MPTDCIVLPGSDAYLFTKPRRKWPESSSQYLCMVVDLYVDVRNCVQWQSRPLYLSALHQRYGFGGLSADGSPVLGQPRRHDECCLASNGIMGWAVYLRPAIPIEIMFHAKDQGNVGDLRRYRD